MGSDEFVIFCKESCVSVPNVTKQSYIVTNCVLESISPEPRESDQEGNNTLYTDINVVYSDVKMEAKDIKTIGDKADPRSSTWCSNGSDILGQIVKNCDNAYFITKPLDGVLECFIQPQPGCSTWSSDNDNVLGQLKEELVVKDTIKAEMESPHRESDQEGNNTLYTNIDVTYSDVKTEYKKTVNSKRDDDKRDSCSRDSNQILSPSITHKKYFLANRRTTRFFSPICCKNFNQASSLKIHYLKHAKKEKINSKKSFSCLPCSKCFSNQTGLLQHILTHFEEKPFSCSECSHCFKRKGHLKRHMLIHSKKRKFRKTVFSCSKRCKRFNKKICFEATCIDSFSRCGPPNCSSKWPATVSGLDMPALEQR